MSINEIEFIRILGLKTPIQMQDPPEIAQTTDAPSHMPLCETPWLCQYAIS